MVLRVLICHPPLNLLVGDEGQEGKVGSSQGKRTFFLKSIVVRCFSISARAN